MTVSLRPLSESDLPFLYHWLYEVTEPQWKQWDGPYFAPAPHLTYDKFCQSSWACSTDNNRRIIDVAGKPVGIVTRHEEDPVGGGWYETGIVIYDPQHWKHGIGTQALSLWTKLTFAETNAHLLTLTTWSGNERMIRCGRRIGFTECARIPQARLWDGKRWDSVKLVILRSEAERLP
ncbi:GNAT family N-acetyltransferase [Trueperella sp. LYQ143]|uniref:GNAT family N-acetyltransferase n=1 Tax=Trueperella sp. LYQ143 TaxID=3391059 RepID=UPI00398323A5